jgi:hypothetical protein
MKKFLRFYLPIIIVFICIGFYSVSDYRNALKCLNENGCRVVSTTRNAVVKIDGRESLNSKIFEDETNYYLVSDAYKIINKSKNAVTYPECYATIYSSYLLLPDCVHGIFLSDTVKGNGFDEKLEITSSNVEFIIPETEHFKIPNHKIEIIFKGE